MKYFYIYQFLALTFFPLIWGNRETTLQEAYNNYQKGEHAQTYKERQLFFNHALFLFNSVENSEANNPALNQALGNTYFQLGQYAWAILHYQRALKNGSTNPNLLPHLKRAQERLGLPVSETKTGKSNFLITSIQQNQLLFWLIFITFLAGSCTIWLAPSWICKMVLIGIFTLSFILESTLFFYYSAPLEGVLVQSTSLYLAPNKEQPQMIHTLLYAGSIVQILSITDDGKWLKIQHSKEKEGYILTQALCLI